MQIKMDLDYLIKVGNWNNDNLKKLWKHFRLGTHENFYIFNTNIDDNGAKYIADIIKNNKQLKYIWFQCVNINMKTICKGLKCSICLNFELYNMENNINLKHIANVLKYNHSIQHMSIECYSINNNDLKYIGQVLKHNKILKIIDFTNCSINDKGCKFISEGLKYNKCLESITLSFNKIGDIGLKYIYNSLKHNKCVKKLDISYNDIGNKGVKYICNLLKHNKYLEIFSITSCYIDLEGQLCILKALLTNNNLKQIYINDFLLDGSNILGGVTMVDIDYMYNILKYNKNITVLDHGSYDLLDNPSHDDEYTEEDAQYFRKIQEYIQEIISKNKENMVQKNIMLLDLL